MDFNDQAGLPDTKKSQDKAKIIVAVTPSLNRQTYLVRQAEAFWKPYQDARARDPGLPELKWIIVDESSEPCAYFQENHFEGLTYIHLPTRHDLSTVPEKFREACADCLHSEDSLKDHVNRLATTLSDRFAVVHNPAIPSIGEMRNIGIKIAERLYLERDPNAIVFAKDDDDFSAAEALPVIYDLLQQHDFVKFGNMLIYEALSEQWYVYSMKHQDDETFIIENGKKQTLPHYVVWDNKAETLENKHKHLGIYGCTFSYRLDMAAKLGNERADANGYYGPFEPLSRREDVAFSDLVVRERGLERVAVMDNPESWMVRIVHNNATRTMHHGTVDAARVDKNAMYYTCVLTGQEEKADAPAADSTRGPSSATIKMIAVIL